jgi:alkylation response protein AidB-like acyl-CoA dehydrogenase
MTKVFTTGMCSRTHRHCTQILEGTGLTSEMRLPDGWQRARIARCWATPGHSIARSAVGQAAG